MKSSLKALALVAITSTALSAANFSFTGTFAIDNQVQFFTFTVTDPSAPVTLLTEGFGGGIFNTLENVSGTTVNAGGFATGLAWFDNMGTEVGFAGTDQTQHVNLINGIAGDSYYSHNFSTGTYTLALYMDGNGPVTVDLADGFAQDGYPGFSCIGSTGAFCNVSLPTGHTSGDWAVDIIQVSAASEVSSTPEPDTFFMLGLPFVALAVARRRGHA
jgi:hypothetical protein